MVMDHEDSGALSTFPLSPDISPTSISVRKSQGFSDKELRAFGFDDTEIEWRAQALCLGMGEAVFFPDRGYSMLPAYVICHSCPVRLECLDSAFEWGDIHGIRAGFTPYEREQIQERIEQGDTLIQAMSHWDQSREEKLRKARTRL